MQYGTNITPVEGADTPIQHDAHLTVVGVDGGAPNTANLWAYRGYGRSVLPEIRDATLGRCDDIGDRTALRGQAQLSVDDDAALVLSQSASGSRQAGCLRVPVVRERTSGAGLRSFGAAVVFDVPYWDRQTSTRLSELGEDFVGVTAGVIGPDGRGVQVALWQNDDGDYGMSLYGFSEDGAGTREAIGSAQMNWSTPAGVALLFVMDADSGRLWVLAQPGTRSSTDETVVVGSANIGGLVRLIAGADIARWTAAPDGYSMFIAQESTVVGDQLRILGMYALPMIDLLLMSGTLRQGAQFGTSALWVVNEVRGAGAAGIADGNGISRDVVSLRMIVGGSEALPRVYDATPLSAEGWYLAARLRVPTSLRHAGTMQVGVALAGGEGERRVQVSFMDDFNEGRRVRLHVSGDPGDDTGYEGEAANVGDLLFVELYALGDRYALRVDGGAPVLVDAEDMDGVEDDTPGLWVGRPDTTAPTAAGEVAIDYVCGAARAWCYLPAAGDGDWAVTEGGVWMSEEDGTARLVDGMLTLPDHPTERTRTGVALQTEIQVHVWLSELGVSLDAVEVGPLLWLVDLEGNGHGVYATRHASGNWYIYHRTAEDDLLDVQEQTVRGRQISARVPSLTAAPVRIRIGWDAVNQTQVWVGHNPIPAISARGWMPTPANVLDDIAFAVGIGQAGSVSVTSIIYAEGDSASIRTTAPAEVVYSDGAVYDCGLLLMWESA